MTCAIVGAVAGMGTALASGSSEHTWALWDHGVYDGSAGGQFHVYMSSTDGAAREGVVASIFFAYNLGPYHSDETRDIASHVHTGCGGTACTAGHISSPQTNLGHHEHK